MRREAILVYITFKTRSFEIINSRRYKADFDAHEAYQECEHVYDNL